MTRPNELVREYRDAAGCLLAVVICRDYKPPGVNFVTAPDLSQQVAFIKWPSGHLIQAHYHQPVPRESYQPTQEVLFIRSGHLRCALYDAGQDFVAEVDLLSGDLILLVGGGHGFQVVSEVEVYEAKQGPYNPQDDKVLFRMDRPCQVCGTLTHLSRMDGDPVCVEHV